jgi:hypothetical protein
MSASIRRLTAAAGAIAALAATASACPSCSVGQGLETLAYVLGFLGIPYLIVSGVALWIRKVTAQERGL